MHRRSFLAVLSFIVLGQWGLAGATVAEARPYIDAAGRKVELPDTIKRVMAAGPPASVLLYALAPEKMVGWVRAPSDEEKAFIASPYRDLPAHGRLTGKGNTASLEAVLALKPDVIIDVGTVDATYASLADKVQEQTGIPYVLVDGGFDQSADTLRAIGVLLGKHDEGEALAAFAEAAQIRIQATVGAVPVGQRPRVYYGRGPEGLESGLSGSINTEILAKVGAANVADDAGSGGLANVSLEQVLAWNPDVILTLDKSFEKAVRQDPLWANVAAVKAGRIFRAPTLPFGWFDSPPGINRIIGAEWLTSVLYPDRSKIDLRGEARAYYKLFYHVDISDAQMDRLLAPSSP